MKRRVLLARALVADPDILLLDEPTNHLDIDAIRWLEEFLLRYGGTLVFVTHDRVFLERLATRIVELDRGRLYDWACDYPTFLKRKEQSAGRRGAAERPSSTRGWPRRRRGSARGSRPAGPATRAGSGRSRPCARPASSAASGRAPPGCSVQEAERSGSLVIEAKGVELRLRRPPRSSAT